MEKINRFFAKHHWGAFWTVAIVTFVAILASDLVDQRVGAWLFFWYGGLMLWIFFLGSRRAVLVREPCKIFKEQCDPYPYLEELRVQKGYSGPKILELSRMTAECACLSRIGENEKAYMQLAPLQETVAKQLRQDIKADYCFCMMMLCVNLDKPHEVETWRHYFFDTYGRIRSAAVRKRFEKGLPRLDSVYYFYKKDYRRSMLALEQFSAECLMDRVDLAWIYGRNYMAMGETEKAKEAFAFVAESGNKFYCVTQARQMLREIAEKEGEG